MVTNTQSSDLFAEEDLPRLFRRSVADVDPENPPEGYQPVLEVTIPGEVSFEKGARAPVFEPNAVGPADCEWNTHPDVGLDAKLMQLLTDSFVGTEPVDLTEQGLVVPAVDLSRRTFVAYFDEVLDDFLAAIDPDNPREQRLARQLATNRVSAHETEGHFQSLIHPENACPRSLDAWTNTLTPSPSDPPVLSHRYEEVRSIVAEEAAVDRMVNEDDPTVRAIAEDITAHARDRHTHATGSVAQILTFLEAHLTREEILEVLDIAREVWVYPEQWLCHVLYDLATGRAREPADFRTDAASVWAIAASREEDSYEDSHNTAVTQRDSLFETPIAKATMSPVEVVWIGEVGVTRRWLAYDPSSLVHGAIRLLLLAREDLSIRNALIEGRLINNGVEPGAFVTMRFQDEGWDPFARAMASDGDEDGEITPEDLFDAFDWRFDKEAHDRTYRQAAARAVDRLGFDDGDDYREWLGDEFRSARAEQQY